MSSIDLGNEPVGTPPTPEEQAQIRAAIDAIPDAPADGKPYARQDGDWAEVATDATNLRAYAGGVATVQGGYARMPSGFDSSTRALTLYWRGIIHRFGTTNQWCLLGNVRGVYNENPYGIGIRMSSGGTANFFYAGAGSFGDQTASSTLTVPLGLPVEIIGTVSAAGVMQLTVAGIGAAPEATIPDYSNGITDDDLFLHAGIRAGTGTIITDFAGDATCYEYGFFNRALSSSERNELAEIGLGAWLAKYPEDKWGGYPQGNDPFVAQFNVQNFESADSGGWTGDTTGSFRVQATGDNVFSVAAGNVVVVNFDSNYAHSNGIVLRDGTLIDVAARRDVVVGTNTIMLTATADSDNCRITFLGSEFTGAAITNFKFSKIGALAALPMDEGLGYQLHDLSGRYDALLSETGFQHLQPKSEGKVRVKGADASSAIYMLGARDIIPADAVWTQIISEERVVAVANTAQDLADRRIRLNPSGSDLLIQRSDGANHDTLGTVAAPTSLADIDAEIHYKQQAR